MAGHSPSSLRCAGAEIVSPCIGVCTLGRGDTCMGCFRTSEEIANWQTYSKGDRSRIMAELPARLDALFLS